MLSWWIYRFFLKVVALFIFLCAVFFVREVVQELFSPSRQVTADRPVYGAFGDDPWVMERAASDNQSRMDFRPSKPLSMER